MNYPVLIRVFLCILILVAFLYTYLHKQNAITELRLLIPLATQEIEDLKQENMALKFEIDAFENPEHLMELARKPEYRHLKHPHLKDIIEVK